MPNGETAGLRRVSQELFYRIYESNPPPPPPTNRVERPDGTVADVPNPSDPEYQQALARHNGEIGYKIRDFIVQHALVFELTDDMKAEVAALRESSREFGVTLPSNDKVVYYVHIACATIEESNRIIQAVKDAWGVSGPKSSDGNDASTSVSEGQK